MPQYGLRNAYMKKSKTPAIRQNALLFEKEDYKALAEYIESLVKDSSIRTDLGNNSWRIYEEKFNVKTNVDRLIDYYKLP